MKFETIDMKNGSRLDIYISDKIEKLTRKAILIMPGGGYECICSDREGESIAQAFAPYGYNAFVLHYSVDGEKTFPSQLIQASEAMKHIKDNAEEYGIDKDEVFAIGFSAGGHLAASLGVVWNKKEIYDETDMPYGYNKPKGIMLIYPVISGIREFAHKDSFYHLLGTNTPSVEQLKQASIELNVTNNASPAYIVHAADDDLVPVENSLFLAVEYSKLNIPYEMHIYPHGGHGFGLGNKITSVGNPNSDRADLSEWVKNAAFWADNMFSVKNF